jgi:hypothetical protein
MSESYQNEEIKKATVKIEKSLYLFVKGNFYHGQLSKLIRNVFESVQVLIQNGKIKDVILYISGQRNLTLPKIKQKNRRDKL